MTQGHYSEMAAVAKDESAKRPDASQLPAPADPVF
jgi:hypothetical protein